jgi:hypothetical protein
MPDIFDALATAGFAVREKIFMSILADDHVPSDWVKDV